MKDYKMVQLDKDLGIDDEVKEIEQIFYSWLRQSNLTETDFLKFRTVSDFNIREIKRNDDFCEIKIGYGFEKFNQIGVELLIRKNDVENFMTLALMLLYIGNKLDNANFKAPVFEQRKNYFTYIIKSFIKENDKFKLLNL